MRGWKRRQGATLQKSSDEINEYLCTEEKKKKKYGIKFTRHCEEEMRKNAIFNIKLKVTPISSTEIGGHWKCWELWSNNEMENLNVSSREIFLDNPRISKNVKIHTKKWWFWIISKFYCWSYKSLLFLHHKIYFHLLCKQRKIIDYDSLFYDCEDTDNVTVKFHSIYHESLQ